MCVTLHCTALTCLHDDVFGQVHVLRDVEDAVTLGGTRETGADGQDFHEWVRECVSESSSERISTVVMW